MSEVERAVAEALKKGKMVIVTGFCDSKVKLEYPRDKIEVVTRS